MLQAGQNAPTQIGQLQLATFVNTGGLQSVGENLFVDGGGAFDGGAPLVADAQRAYRGGAATGLVLQVASARLPCGKVDQKHAQAAGRGGVRAHCAATGRAGAFLRVLAAGDVAPGDRLRLAARPRARWTLRRCSELLYGGGNDGEYLARAYAADRDHRTRASHHQTTLFFQKSNFLKIFGKIDKNRFFSGIGNSN